MTVEELETLFEKHNEEFLKFDRVVDPKSTRPDLQGFLLLDRLVPGESDIVSAAAHDEIWFGIDLEDLAKVITEEQVIELLRCGISLSDGSLHSFV